MNAAPQDLLREYVRSQHFTSTADVMTAMKEMFRDVINQVMEVEMDLAEAKSIVTAKKMMWGTDAPFAATNDSYENLTDYLQKGSAFTEEELEDVYYNNAKFVYFD